MPYNTRRKSLSLPSLGIHVPVTHAARDAARAAAAAATAASRPATSNANSTNSANNANSTSPVASSTPSSSNNTASAAGQRQLTSVSDTSKTNMAPPSTSTIAASSLSPKRASSAVDSSPSQQPSSKRTKRSHSSSESISSVLATAASKSSAVAKPVAVATPPQSPKRQASVEMDDVEEVEIDMDKVKDDIVEAVIIQLKSTGNRPHLIKELSAILMHQLKSVQQSANPCAIISSRLASYMKRPCWSTLQKCPLTKELETIHPRRTYYFLTTCPHLPLPDALSVHFIVPRTSIVTPPLSSAASGSEATEEERRRELSPSPEVDLSAPEFDDLDDDLPMPGTPNASLSHRYPRYPRFSRYHHHHRSSSSYSSRNHRGASPPLEKDEKEFTQTAEGLQKQKHAAKGSLLSPATIAAQAAPPSNSMYLDDAGRDESLLFDSESRHIDQFALMTSPAMRPIFSLGPKRDTEAEGWAKLDSMVSGWDQCPESIELDELDCLLDEF
ncbi:hypothetical protein SCUCBS95973_005446 [Sporothrix curviconia]|uniref:GDS1 winged helix domain-containing protein n=1 Tax=Sporothrix curviconia TaxID=1260050 RepID=A0ABP0BX39_9PEZI